MKESSIFPLGITSAWHEPNHIPIPDAKLKNWLLDTGSLTERLESRCLNFKVQLIGQQQMSISIEESQHFKQVDGDIQWQVREVVLLGDNQPWVFARSIIPEQMCLAEFADLGSQPLGKLIFNDSRFIRSPFQISHIIEPQTITSPLNIHCSMPLWGRRSIFQFEKLSMSVAEVFLPNSPAYSNMT